MYVDERDESKQGEKRKKGKNKQKDSNEKFQTMHSV